MFKLLQCRVLLSALQLPLQLAYPVACLDSILQANHSLGRVGELKWIFVCIPFSLETGSPSLLFITTNSYLSVVAWCCSSFLQLSPSKTSCPALCMATCWLCLLAFFPYIQCRPSCLFSPGMALPLSIFSPACSLNGTCCCFLLWVQFKSIFFLHTCSDQTCKWRTSFLFCCFMFLSLYWSQGSGFFLALLPTSNHLKFCFFKPCTGQIPSISVPKFL